MTYCFEVHCFCINNFKANCLSDRSPTIPHWKNDSRQVTVVETTLADFADLLIVRSVSWQPQETDKSWKQEEKWIFDLKMQNNFNSFIFLFHYYFTAISKCDYLNPLIYNEIRGFPGTLLIIPLRFFTQICQLKYKCLEKLICSWGKILQKWALLGLIANLTFRH